MTGDYAKIESIASVIVAVGEFNPAIITPEWLFRNELIGEGDEIFSKEKANSIITNQISAFETKAFALNVTQEKLSVSTKSAMAPTCRDVAQGILQLLSHTPIKAIGLNVMAHFKFKSANSYHRFGDSVAPKGAWNRLFENENLRPGLMDLTIKMQEVNEENRASSEDHVQISIQPSAQFENGVFLAYNAHYAIGEKSETALTAAEKGAKLIADEWQVTVDKAKVKFDRLFDFVLGGQ